MKHVALIFVAAILNVPATASAALPPGETAKAVEKECAGLGPGGAPSGGPGVLGAAIGFRNAKARQAGRCAAAKIACKKKAKAAGKKVASAKTAKGKSTGKDVGDAAKQCEKGNDKGSAGDAQKGQEAAKQAGGSPMSMPQMPQQQQQEPQQAQQQQQMPESKIADKPKDEKKQDPWQMAQGKVGFPSAKLDPKSSTTRIPGDSRTEGRSSNAEFPGIKSASIPQGGGGMGGGAGGGTALGGGPGAMLAPAARAKVNTDIEKGFMSGGGGGDGGGGGFSGYGRGPASEEKEKLENFLPDHKKGPTLDSLIAGHMPGRGAEIQPKQTNIWTRISATIQRRCAEGRLRDCIP